MRTNFNSPETDPCWARISLEQAELLVEYLRKTRQPDTEFVKRHALSIYQAAATDQLISAADAEDLYAAPLLY